MGDLYVNGLKTACDTTVYCPGQVNEFEQALSQYDHKSYTLHKEATLAQITVNTTPRNQAWRAGTILRDACAVLNKPNRTLLETQRAYQDVKLAMPYSRAGGTMEYKASDSHDTPCPGGAPVPAFRTMSVTAPAQAAPQSLPRVGAGTQIQLPNGQRGTVTTIVTDANGRVTGAKVKQTDNTVVYLAVGAAVLLVGAATLGTGYLVAAGGSLAFATAASR